MKRLGSFRDLEPFGIEILTGEACNIGRRALCDLTRRGERIVRDLVGLPPDAKLAPGWNGKATASAMIPYELFEDLAIWCLLDEGCTEIVLVEDGVAGGFMWEGGVYGLKRGDNPDEWTEWLERMNQFGKPWRRIHTARSSQPHVGTRNTHQMSGRTA